MDYSQQQELYQAYFFCKGDSLTESSMKFGTLVEARKVCAEIHTPKICGNKCQTS